MMAVTRNLLAYGSDGRVMVIAHEREVLVYSGVDESPLWRCECEAEIVAVGAHPEFVFALDEDGGLHRWDALTGESQQTMHTDVPALGMAVAGNGACAVFSNDAISIIHGSSVIQSLQLNSITAVAWSADDCQLACGADTGLLRVYHRSDVRDLFSPHPPAMISLNDPILSIACYDGGTWMVAAGNAVLNVNMLRKSSTAVMSNTHEPPRMVAVSLDGRLVAFAMGDHDVLAMYLDPTDYAGMISYQDRDVTGLAFGPNSRLGIGLDSGDGNIINYAKPGGGVARTDPHPGRPLNRWLLNVSIMPRSARSAEKPTANAFPAWSGPLVGLGIGLVIGLRISRNVKPDEAPWAIIGAMLLGLGGGCCVWIADFLKKK